ncbi:MAG: hypothetical protein M5U14_20395 [Acidimicrobiia bacterium]|nr:hypothetical protein [Acidimicrobiia bacterium]
MGELGNVLGEAPTFGFAPPQRSAGARLPLAAKRSLFESYRSWLDAAGGSDTTGSLTTFTFEEASRRLEALDLGDPTTLVRRAGDSLDVVQNLHEELPYRFAADAGHLRSSLLAGEAASPVEAATEIEGAFEAGKSLWRRALQHLRDRAVAKGQAALDGKVDAVVEAAERRLADTGHALYQGTRSLLGVNERPGEPTGE